MNSARLTSAQIVTARVLTPASISLILSALFLFFIVVAALVPSLIAPGDPLAIQPAVGFTAPSLTHPFGTDESGRDIYTRVVHGTSASVGIGLAATAIGVIIGSILGFAAGLGPRWLDAVLARVFEVLFALPTLVIALLFVAVLGGGAWSATLAIGLATIPGYARMIRARVRGIAASGYAEWARLDGASSFKVFGAHIAPNSLWPLVSAATLGIGQSIVWVAALGFLGLGAEPPAPEWGAMLDAGRVYLSSAWWMTVLPGATIVATATALTVIGRHQAEGRRQ
ncbi:MAG: ABC transporter permease [Leucobacter sp.]